jgi:hypothetical protein
MFNTRPGAVAASQYGSTKMMGLLAVNLVCVRCMRANWDRAGQAIAECILFMNKMDCALLELHLE